MSGESSAMAAITPGIQARTPSRRRRLLSPLAWARLARWSLMPLLSVMRFFLAIALASSASAAVPTQFNSAGPGGGGALFAPSFSPFHPGEMFLACDLSAVFHSTNYGYNWNVVNFQQLEGGRQAIVQFTGDSNVLYCINLANDAMTPARSVDGGASWQTLAADPTYGGAYALFADPSSTNRLIVSDYDDFYLSTDGGNSFTLEFTDDNGGNGCFLAGAFFNASNIFVCTSLGLVVSTNNGASFALANVGGIDTNNEQIFSFAAAEQNGVTRFLCTTQQQGNVYPGLTIESQYTAYVATYSLLWGQADWALATNGISGQDDPVFVAMAQNDISTAYLAGQQNTDVQYPAVYKTSNGGTNWALSLFVTNNLNVYTGWAGNHGDSDWGYGAGALGLAVAPNDSSKVAYTDLGFTHLSTNGGVFWEQGYVNPADQNSTNAPTPKGHFYHSVGLENTSCWFIAWANSNQVFAGYTDIKGVYSTNDGASWSFGYSGDSYNSMYCVKSNNGVLYGGVSTVHDMYQSTHLTDASIGNAGGAILLSSNQGVTWQTMHNFNCPVIWLEVDPVNTNTILASVISTNQSTAGIYISTNTQLGASSTWRRLAAPPRTQGHPMCVHRLADGWLICSYSGRRAGSPQEFTASSGIFYSVNNGASWVDCSDANMDYWTMDLVVDPSDAAQNTWYVGVYSGWGGPPNGLGGLYMTTNRGTNWTWLVSSDGVTSCTINPLNSNELYATTEEAGLLYCGNIRSASPTFTTVAGYPFGQPERVFFNPSKPSEMWVTSFGNGLRIASTQSLPGTLILTPQASGSAQITLQAASPNAPYAILVSTNLSTWTPVSTNTANSDGTLQFTDSTATNDARFYKSQAQ